MRPDIKQAIDLYALFYQPTGDFLRLFLSNDLMGALGRADTDNIRDFHEIGKYIYNEIPGVSWGSPEAYQAWVKRGEKDDD